MADDKNTPFSVRMDADDKTKLIKMIEDSGVGSNKEFMNTLMSAYELNKVKVEIPEASEGIKKVEELTQLINDCFVNISKHIKITKDSMNLQFTKDVDVYKVRLESLKDENSKLESKFEGLQIAYNNSCNDIEELKKESESKEKLIEQLKESINDKTILVQEYKDKNDTMAGIVEEYKNYKVEVEEYKKLLADSQSRNIELENIVKEKDFSLTKLNDTIEDLKLKNETIIQNSNIRIKELDEKHADNINSIKEKSEFEKEKALLVADKKYQEEINKLNDSHNEKIKELLLSNEDYNKKIKELLD